MEIKNLYFSYGPNDKNGAHDILKDVSFSIKEGKFLEQMVVENLRYFSL